MQVVPNAARLFVTERMWLFSLFSSSAGVLMFGNTFMALFPALCQAA